MAHDPVIGIISGHGWMARALGLAWLEQGLVPASRLVVSSRSGGESYRDWPEVRCVTNNRELAAQVEVLVLSVRPEELASRHNFIAYRRTSDFSGYVLGGRTLGPFATTLSSGASEMSGWLLIAMPGVVFLMGVSSLWLLAW